MEKPFRGRVLTPYGWGAVVGDEFCYTRIHRYLIKSESYPELYECGRFCEFVDYAYKEEDIPSEGAYVVGNASLYSCHPLRMERSIVTTLEKDGQFYSLPLWLHQDNVRTDQITAYSLVDEMQVGHQKNGFRQRFYKTVLIHRDTYRSLYRLDER